jgi:hypothetical protein
MEDRARRIFGAIESDRVSMTTRVFSIHHPRLTTTVLT